MILPVEKTWFSTVTITNYSYKWILRKHILFITSRLNLFEAQFNIPTKENPFYCNFLGLKMCNWPLWKVKGVREWVWGFMIFLPKISLFYKINRNYGCSATKFLGCALHSNLIKGSLKFHKNAFRSCFNVLDTHTLTDIALYILDDLICI